MCDGKKSVNLALRVNLLAHLESRKRFMHVLKREFIEEGISPHTIYWVCTLEVVNGNLENE